MKILRVINSLYIGGAERSILGNVPIHIKNGYDMDVLLLNGEDTFFLKQLQKEKVKIIILGKSKKITNLLFILKIAKIINKYDIVHAHLFPSLYWVALAKIFKRSKTKLVFTEHNTHNKRRNSVVFKYVDRWIYKQYEEIIAITPQVKKNLEFHVNRHQNIITIYNGVDLNKIASEKDSLTNSFKEKYDGKKILVQVASFTDQKDQDTLIKAMTLLPTDFHVLFVGDGERINICKKLAGSLGVFEKISFLGLQDNVSGILNIADVFIMSSHWEGFGRAAIEAMAANKPVIATNVPGLAEIVKDAGLLFEVGNENELARLISRLCNNEGFCKEIADKCFKRAKDFDIKKMVSLYEEVYTKLM